MIYLSITVALFRIGSSILSNCMPKDHNSNSYYQKMNFSYQLYVNRMNYQPFQWPPDISLAELHSRVSEQGPVNEQGVRCPCCGFQSKKKFKGWIMRDIAEDCEGLGTAVPAYFGLLKFYTIAIFLVMLINSIYPLWAMYYTCQNLAIPNSVDECLQVGFLYYLDFDIQLRILDANNRQDIVQNLVFLETVAYYVLLMVNVGSLFYLFYMEKKEEKEQHEHLDVAKNALIMGNVPDADVEKLKERLNMETKLEIADVIPLKDVKRYFELFNKRNTIYFKLMSSYVLSMDPRSEKKLNKTLATLHEQLLIEKERLANIKHSNLLIVFKTSYMTSLVYQNYEFSQLNKLIFGTKALLIDAGVSKKVLELPIHAVRVPHTKQIKWENAGESAKSKLVGRIKSFFIAIGIIIICLFILEEPIRWSLDTHTGDPKKLSIFQKILPIVISFLLFALSIFYRNYMVQVAKRRNPLNEFQASKFVLMATMLFHIIFYIIIPTAFFAVSDGINPTIKLYVIAEQARTFIFMQLIICIIDVPYQLWKNRKIKNLSDQREGFKYCQKMLHRTVEYRDYPLEIRLQAMFRIWSFALFYIFYLPYIMFYMFVALNILYLLEKRNFYLHYTLRRAIPLKLEKAFLIYFVNFFCFFQCFAYCLHAEYDWMIIAATSVTAGVLMLNLAYWKCVQPTFRREKERVGELTEQLMSQVAQEKKDYAMERAREEAADYASSYERFLESIMNDQLDEEMSEYLRSAEVGEKGADAKAVEKMIEMAESEFDGELD